MSHFNQSKIERKNYVWTTKYKRLLEMCIVQHVEMKEVFTFQLTKLPKPTTVENAKPALTCWMFLLRTKNKQLSCLAVVVHNALQGKRVVILKKKNLVRFWRSFSANGNQAHPNLSQEKQKSFRLWHNRVDSPLVDKINQNIFFHSHFKLFQSTVKQHDFLNLQRR